MSGTIVLEGAPAPLPVSARVRVRLEDVSRADAPARIVAEQVGRAAPQRALEFALHGPPLDPDGSYSVRVHVDMNGDGRVAAGDFVSVESHPVVAGDVPQTMSVRVRRIPGGE